MIHPIVLITVIVTAYVPGGGGINGGLTGAFCENGQCRILRIGDCACGPSHPFNTVFVIDGTAYTCYDRGSAIGNRNVDIVHRSLESAFEWGRRAKRVEVWAPGHYDVFIERISRYR